MCRTFDTLYEIAMPDTLAQWHTEHVNFAKLLNLLEAELDLFHKGDSPNYELMLDIMFYMTHYPDVLHHPREDLGLRNSTRICARSARNWSPASATS